MTTTRVTQDVAEVLSLPEPPSRFTQDVAEVLWLPQPVSRFTTDVVEVLVSDRPLSRFTSVVAEVLVPNAEPEDTGGGTRQLWPRGGDPVLGGSNPPSGAVGGTDVTGTYPDELDVVGIKGLPLVGTLGSNQVWGKDPSAAQLIPLTPGSPTLSYQRWDPDKPPTSPSALDEEWNGGPTLSSSYTTLSPGTQTVDVNSTRASALRVKTDGTSGWRGIVRNDQSIAAGDFSVACNVGVLGEQADFTLAGIYVSDGILTSSPQLRFTMGFHSSFGSWGCYAERTTDLSGVSQVTVHAPKFLPHPEVVFRITRSGSNYKVGHSFDGEHYYDSGNITLPFTATRWGVVYYCSRGASAGEHYWKWVRYQAVANAKFGGLVNVYG